ncbi:MAG: triose-phosphate isomerase [Geminicoccaceae bacterium]|nr:triose-phosphate isomerase [Geminicoccaceae bacterium]MCB9943194.1 triose-phosphate isomerase [Geminicoccaceae bacterium]
MALPRPIVLGNWKMNGLRSDGLALAGGLADAAAALSGTFGIFPPATIIGEVVRRVASSNIVVGGQDCHEKASGAYTGSVSASMLRDIGATSVIVGHSERRHGLGETDAVVKAKAEAALAAGLLTVLCIGETEADYVAGRQIEVLQRQIDNSLPASCHADRVVIAYEPVWAIGTGRTPTLDEIAVIHGKLAGMTAMRTQGEPLALLYGGSVKPDNAADIMSIDHVDGVLVGGASLDVGSFWSIYTAGGGA